MFADNIATAKYHLDLGELDLRMGDIDTDVVVIDGESYTPRKCRETKVQAGFIAHVKSKNSQA